MRTYAIVTAALALTSSVLTSPVASAAITDDPEQVVVVKIDNAKQARPLIGLTGKLGPDVVYVLPVPDGGTQLMAAFLGRSPTKIGPVGKAQASDINILKQFGRPALAHSGAAPEVMDMLETAEISQVTTENGKDAFSRDPDRPDSYNLYVDAEKALATATGVNSHLPDFEYGPLPADGTPTTVAEAQVGNTPVSVTWSVDRKVWQIEVDDEPLMGDAGRQAEAGTVVIQKVKINDSGIADITSSGKADVLRDRTEFNVEWKWNDDRKTTEFFDEDGEPVALNYLGEGPVWIVLVPAS